MRNKILSIALDIANGFLNGILVIVEKFTDWVEGRGR